MFTKVDKTELCIREMQNIKMVHVYELTGAEAGTGSCTAIAVIFGDRQMLNLCELDPCFEMLEDRLYELYDSIKDDDSVIMDGPTRVLLERGIRHCESTVPEYFYKLDPRKTPKVPFESFLSGRFLSLAGIVLENLYRLTGSSMTITGQSKGWRGASLLFGAVNGVHKRFTIKMIRKTDERYVVRVMGFLTDFGELLIDISLKTDRLQINYASDSAGITGSDIYEFSEDGCEITHVAFRDREKIFYEHTPAGEVSSEIEYVKDISMREAAEHFGLDKVAELVTFTGKVTVTKLPGQLFFITERSKRSDGGAVREQLSCSYLYGDAGFADTRYRTHVSDTDSKTILKTMTAVVYRMLLRDGEIQTYFVPHSGNAEGRYREHLEGYYFIEGASEDRSVNMTEAAEQIGCEE